MPPSRPFERPHKWIGAAKRAHRDSLIPPSYRLSAQFLQNRADARDVRDTACDAVGLLMTQREIDVVYSDTAAIVHNLQSRTWSCVDVCTAFCKSAAIAQQMTNCLTEILFDEALRRAHELDAFYEANGRPIGPLHGLPVSVKDNFKIAGYAATVGHSAWAHEIMAEDSELVKMLRGLGAVLYVKTNVPVSMMMAESMNNVTGTTTNPFNRLLSAGGSSGGEAALIAMHGSPLGVGTDIGGSIRIPSAFNNLYGLRPSFGRFPTHGARSAMPGQEAVPSVNGPMANSVGGLKVFAQSVVGAEPWVHHDPKMLPLPWWPVQLPQKLCFGVIWHDGMARAHPPIQRGLRIAVGALRRAGHTVIDWEPRYHQELNHILERFFLADGGTHIAEVIAETGEPFFPYMYPYRDAYASGTADVPTSQMWKLQAERTALCKSYLDYWNGSATRTGTGRPVDAIISPASVFSGNQIGVYRHVAYTGVWNILDYSAATFPVTRADREVDRLVPTGQEPPLGTLDRELRELYDPDIYHGGAVALQLVARRLEEERLLEMLEVVANAVDYKSSLMQQQKPRASRGRQIATSNL